MYNAVTKETTKIFIQTFKLIFIQIFLLFKLLFKLFFQTNIFKFSFYSLYSLFKQVYSNVLLLLCTSFKEEIMLLQAMVKNLLQDFIL